MARFAQSVDLIGTAPGPSLAERRGCVLLVEQVDVRSFPGAADLPSDCAVVRFPSVDTNLLWPFGAINQYDEVRLPDFPRGRYPYGDRILLRCIEKGWDADRVIAYYDDHYADFRVDLARVAVLERARLEARDRKADVAMSDATRDLRTAPLFVSSNHPNPQLLRLLATRVAATCALAVPELAAFVPPGDGFAWYRDPTAIPIHPGVAAELGLAWYDPAATYFQVDGTKPTSAEYVRGFVEWTIENRSRQLRRGTETLHDSLGWRPPLEGPVHFVGPVLGVYPDNFASPLLRAVLEADASTSVLMLEAYYPPQHACAGTVTFRAGDVSVASTVEPGSALSMELPVALGAGEKARISLTCSQTLNMVERGEGEDNRDLGVLILKMRAE